MLHEILFRSRDNTLVLAGSEVAGPAVVDSSDGPLGRHLDLGRETAVEVLHLRGVDDSLLVLSSLAPVTNWHRRLGSQLAHLLLDIFSVLLLDDALTHLGRYMRVSLHKSKIGLVALVHTFLVLMAFKLQSLCELGCMPLSNLKLGEMVINFVRALSRLNHSLLLLSQQPGFCNLLLLGLDADLLADHLLLGPRDGNLDSLLGALNDSLGWLLDDDLL